jgi:hypothetical protein
MSRILISILMPFSKYYSQKSIDKKFTGYEITYFLYERGGLSSLDTLILSNITEILSVYK